MPLQREATTIMIDPKMRMLGTVPGRFLYHLLRNDVSWGMLSEREKAYVKEMNRLHNNEREDYRAKDVPAGKLRFETEGERDEPRKGRIVDEFLREFNPESVVEIGPGPGYNTRQIVEHPSVKRYAAIEINSYFREYLSERLAAHAAKDPLEFRVLDPDQVEPAGIDADAVIFLSSIHHIPDRVELFSWAASMLNAGGRILALEPSHSWLRVKHLLHKLYEFTIKTKGYFEVGTTVSTHHYCTVGEYRKICGKVGNLHLDRFYLFGRMSRLPRLFMGGLRRLLRLSPFWVWHESPLAAYYADEIVAIFVRR